MQCFNSTDKEVPPGIENLEVALAAPSGGPFLLVFFSLSAKSNLASVLVDGGVCTPQESDHNGNITVRVVATGSSSSPADDCLVKFKSWCPPCMLPVCFQVFGRTRVKVCSSWLEEGGWCLLGQGEFIRNGLVHLRHTPLALEGDTDSLFDVTITKCPPRSTVAQLPAAPNVFARWVPLQSAWREQLPFSNPSFFRISHPLVAVHCGDIPRDLYYWKGIRVAPEVLEGILEIGFLGQSNVMTMTRMQVAERVVFSLTHFVNVTVDYQPDTVYCPRNSGGGVKSFEYFSKGLLVFLHKADCEDLAWYMTSLLESIQDSTPPSSFPLLQRAQWALQEYVPVSAVVQGTAPEFRKSKYNLCLKPKKYVSAEEDKQEQSRMHIFHVTSFLFPKRQFLECVERGRVSGAAGQQWKEVEVEGEDGLHRLYCEPTACVGEDPCKVEITSEEEEASIPSDDSLCLPVGCESPDATLLYGALIEIITNWFVRHKKGPQCFTFVAAITKDGEKTRAIAPEDAHWGQLGAEFAFIASTDVSPLINSDPEPLARYTSDIPVPWLTKLPSGFEERLLPLKDFCKIPNQSLFDNRFKWCLSNRSGEFEHPMRAGIWVTSPRGS